RPVTPFIGALPLSNTGEPWCTSKDSLPTSECRVVLCANSHSIGLRSLAPNIWCIGRESREGERAPAPSVDDSPARATDGLTEDRLLCLCLHTAHLGRLPAAPTGPFDYRGKATSSPGGFPTQLPNEIDEGFPLTRPDWDYETAPGHPQTSHPFQVGDSVYVRRHRSQGLEPRWKGPYIVLLTTPTAAFTTGATGLGVSVTQYTKLSHQLISDVQVLSGTIQDLQDQVDSLAEVVLQNRRGLDLLTAEQGGICLALQEKCCFYANKSGIVRDKIRTLQEELQKRRESLASNPLWTGLQGFLPYLLPLLGPLLTLLLILTIGPCVFSRLMAFINDRLNVVHAMVLAQQYQALKAEEEAQD
uniref:Core shell protein Gag P30 domain-containing protein n=1 Tax=Felis catus TaxID=9685 RepID=A0ABI7ZJV1_FELCA